MRNMNKFRSIEVKIAIFALIGLFLLVWGINFLKGIDIFKKQYTCYVVFENASGLLPSHTVTINGLSIGLVDKIELMRPSNKILVTLSIDKKVEIPVNSHIRIATPNPLSSPQVEILFGNETVYIQDGDTLQGAVSAGLLEGLPEIMGSVKKILISVDTSVMLLQQNLQSGTLDQLTAALVDLRSTIGKIDNLVAVNTPKINAVVSDVQTFTGTLHKNDEKINEMIGNINTISAQLAEAELKKTIDNAAHAIGNIDSLLTKINQGEGSLGQLAVNDSLYINLQNSLWSLDKLLEDIKANPKKYINVTVFGKKEKKK